MMDRNESHQTASGDVEDPALSALLRMEYAAPAGDLYWKGLENRVMARIRESAPAAWWTVFSEWRMPGLAAAAVAMFVAGYALMREQELINSTREYAANVAEFTVFDSSTGGGAVALTVPVRGAKRIETPERYLNLIQP